MKTYHMGVYFDLEVLITCTLFMGRLFKQPTSGAMSGSCWLIKPTWFSNRGVGGGAPQCYDHLPLSLQLESKEWAGCNCLWEDCLNDISPELCPRAGVLLRVITICLFLFNWRVRRGQGAIVYAKTIQMTYLWTFVWELGCSSGS